MFSQNKEIHNQGEGGATESSEKKNKLFLKAEKFKFHVSTVRFLGFNIEQGQLKTDLTKVQAVVEWHITNSRKQL